MNFIEAARKNNSIRRRGLVRHSGSHGDGWISAKYVIENWGTSFSGIQPTPPPPVPVPDISPQPFQPQQSSMRSAHDQQVRMGYMQGIYIDTSTYHNYDYVVSSQLQNNVSSSGSGYWYGREPNQANSLGAIPQSQSHHFQHRSEPTTQPSQPSIARPPTILVTWDDLMANDWEYKREIRNVPNEPV